MDKSFGRTGVQILTETIISLFIGRISNYQDLIPLEIGKLKPKKTSFLMHQLKLLDQDQTRF